MKKQDPSIVLLLVLLLSVLRSVAQPAFNYFKQTQTNIGVSTVSGKSITAKSYQFNYPIYMVMTDTANKQLLVSVRQHDPSGKSFTHKGYHMCIRNNDSIKSVFEDTKLEFEMLGDFLLMSSEVKTGRFNRKFGYEQFEYPSRIIHINSSNETGLSYNPLFKINNEVGLSAMTLNDGKVIWTSEVSSKANWNDIAKINDSLLVIAASGLHGINVNSGLKWSFPLITSLKTNQPFVQPVFNLNTIHQLFHPINTKAKEGLITQLASNILVSDGTIFFAGSDKLIAVSSDGKLLWEHNLAGKGISNCLLVDHDQEILLLNLGLGEIDGQSVAFGKTFAAAFSKQYGSVIYESDLSANGMLTDAKFINSKLYFASRSKIMMAGEKDVRTVFQLSDTKYGKFIEFIDGDEFYTEKEGFFVPLNFINDKVVYFKSDQDKVYGLIDDKIEYVYHYTELYRKLAETNGNKLISQRSKGLIISSNMELLGTLKCPEKAVGLNGKFYLYDGGMMHIVDLEQLK